MNSFDILSRDQKIHKSTILEASAGTGKTFTIEHLVVRFLIEIDPNLNRPLNLDEILIVTFTKKAVRDLKERVRSLIQKTIKIIEDDTNSSIPDYLLALMSKGEEEVLLAKTALQRAYAVFDENKIFTIHGFAARALSENAFETGFSQGEEGDTLSKNELLKLGVDFFETDFSPPEFSKGQLACLLTEFSQNPKKMIEKLVSLSTTYHKIEPKRTFNELFTAFSQERFIISEEELTLFASNYKTVKNKELAVASLSKVLSNSHLEEDDFDKLLEYGRALVTLFSDDHKKVKYKLNENLKNSLDKLLPIIEEAASPDVILVNAASKLKRLVTSFQDNSGRFSFDAILLKSLNAAQENNFKEAISTKYKALVIDEFQDTDPIQWEMFERLLLNGYVFIVGDPKQSIYRFRQADIYTYLKAAEALGQTERSSLSVNYRSNQQLIDGLNLFFKEIDFPLPKLDSHLSYIPVTAGRKEVTCQVEDGKSSFHMVLSEDQDLCIPYIVHEISNSSFNLSQFAILVKDRFQAKAVLDALQTAGIPAISQKGASLLGSITHTSLIELLDGFINWKNQSALRLALAGPIIAFSASEIPKFDDPQFLTIASVVVALRTILYTKGFGLFFEELLSASFGKEQSVGERLLLQKEGDVFYQDLFTLAERVMDVEIKEGLTPERLLSYLKDALLLEIEDHEEFSREMESEKESVKIVTIHSSKGLEYDVVFALGLLSETRVPESIIFHEENQEFTIKALLSSDTILYEKWCEELDAEKLRQLYVGMTRARERLYLFMPMLKKEKIKMGTASPIDLWLSNLQTKANYQELYEIMRQGTEDKLMHFLKSQSVISYEKITEISSSPKREITAPSLKLVAPMHLDVPKNMILISSFTSLSKKAHHSVIDAPSSFDNPIKNPFTLPAGKHTGILLHSIFENIPFTKELAMPLVEKMVQESSFASWTETIKEIVANTLERDLGGFKLCDVKEPALFKEKEFLYDSSPGFLKGVIDLVFTHNGKFYLLDWKTNWLGKTVDAYSQDAMRISMEENAYTLQARIYTKALKNYISLFMEQDFEELFGGAYYIYLRGTGSKEAGVFFIPPQELLKEEYCERA